MKIRITVGDVSLEGKLKDTGIAVKVAEALPFNKGFNTWGDEIYFTIPVEPEEGEPTREEVELGDIAYWPSGQAFCLFFGETPMSTPGKIVPAGPVNIIGKIEGDPVELKSVMNEQNILVEAL